MPHFHISLKSNTKNLPFILIILILIGCSKKEPASVDMEYELIKAVESNYVTRVELLLDKGVDVKLGKYKHAAPIVTAAVNNNLEIIKLLYGAGTDLNQKDREGATALLMAVLNGNFEIIKFLVENGADVNICTPKDASPLLVSVALKQGEIPIYLMDHGANINSKNSSGSSVLLTAISAKDTELALELLKRGAEVNCQTLGNKTSELGMAVHHDMIKVVELLLKKGANPELRNGMNKRPIDYARSSEMKQILSSVTQVIHGEVDPEAERQVRELFTRYKNAGFKNEESKVIHYISNDTIEYIEQMQHLALNGIKTEVMKQPPMNMYFILRLRVLYDNETLVNISAIELCKNLVSNDFTYREGEGLEQFEIGEITIKNTDAYAILYHNNSKVENFELHFVKENNQWRINIMPCIRIMDILAIQQAIKQKLRIHEIVLYTLKDTYGKKVTENIWQPLVKN